MVFTLQKYGFCFLNVVLLQSVSNIIGRLSAAVGADLSCPHIYIRHAFAIRLKHIYVMFATCSLSVCYIFAVQKYGFWRAKTTFLAYKNHLFDLQKVGFCIFVKYISIFIDINKEYERTYNKFIKMVYNCLKRQLCHCVLYIFYI